MMKSPDKTLPTTPSPVDTRVHRVRGLAVMMDSDLAEVYGVETKRINEAVRRNPKRFALPFSFQLTQNEWDALRSQFATLKAGRGQHRKYPPRVFTEHGAVMLATVLNSDAAIQASIAVIDAFVRLRHVLDANQALAKKIDDLAARVDKHDHAFVAVFEELKRLTIDIAPERPRERIGFKTNKERGVTARGRKR